MYCSVKVLAPTTTRPPSRARSSWTTRCPRVDVEQAERRQDGSGPPRFPLDDRGAKRPHQTIQAERKDRGRDAADQHRREIPRLKAAEDVVAEARRADRRRERGHADRQHGRRPDAGENDRHRQRQLDAAQALRRRHADALRGLDHGRIDSGETGDGVAKNRQDAVQRQTDERRQEADAL